MTIAVSRNGRHKGEIEIPTGDMIALDFPGGRITLAAADSGRREDLPVSRVSTLMTIPGRGGEALHLVVDVLRVAEAEESPDESQLDLFGAAGEGPGTAVGAGAA
jgi:hypothetical protein